MHRPRQTFLLVLVSLLLASVSPHLFAADGFERMSARIAIEEVLTQYPYRWDSKASESFAELFSDDAVMERWRDGELIDGSRVEGKAAILEYSLSAHNGRLADRQTRHHFSNLVFLELSDNNAVTENMALITHQTATDRAARISSSGIYRISWVRTSQGWKIAKRILFTDSAPTN